MLAKGRWRTAALVALLALGAWVLLSTWALLDAGFDFQHAAVLVGAVFVCMELACAFAFLVEPRRPASCLVSAARPSRAPPAGLPG